MKIKSINIIKFNIILFLIYFPELSWSQPHPRTDTIINPYYFKTGREQWQVLEKPSQQKSSLELTKTQKLNKIKEYIRNYKHSKSPFAGQRILTNAFKNFEGKYYLDPDIPGFEKTAQLVASNSKSQAKGAIRTIIYAQKAKMAGYKVEAMNKPTTTRLGKTDIDLILKSPKSGRVINIELKDVKNFSLNYDLKLKLNKMVEIGNSALISRGKIPTSIINYCENIGIPCYGKASSKELNKILQNIENYWASRNLYRTNNVSKLSKFSIKAGGITRRPKFITAPRWVGRVAGAIFIVGPVAYSFYDVAYSFYEYYKGYSSPREFTIKISSLSGFAIGAAAAEACTPFAPAVGTLVCGIGVPILGGVLGSEAASTYYEFKDEKVEREFMEFLINYYSSLSESSEKLE